MLPVRGKSGQREWRRKEKDEHGVSEPNKSKKTDLREDYRKEKSRGMGDILRRE